MYRFSSSGRQNLPVSPRFRTAALCPCGAGYSPRTWRCCAVQVALDRIAPIVIALHEVPNVQPSAEQKRLRALLHRFRRQLLHDLEHHHAPRSRCRAKMARFTQRSSCNHLLHGGRDCGPQRCVLCSLLLVDSLLFVVLHLRQRSRCCGCGVGPSRLGTEGTWRPPSTRTALRGRLLEPSLR